VTKQKSDTNWDTRMDRHSLVLFLQVMWPSWPRKTSPPTHRRTQRPQLRLAETKVLISNRTLLGVPSSALEVRTWRKSTNLTTAKKGGAKLVAPFSFLTSSTKSDFEWLCFYSYDPIPSPHNNHNPKSINIKLRNRYNLH